MSAPSYEALESLTTEELRGRAFELAEARHDVGFFWDLLRHLPSSVVAATEDGSAGGIGGTLAEAIGAVRELFGEGYGAAEPLLRARFVDYLHRHGSGPAAG